jgi:multiple sugar transport system ATP-binding protein
LVGIRPEHLSLAGDGQGSLLVRIDVVEPTGPDTLAVFQLGGHEVIARLEAFSASAGSELALAVKSEKIVLFDKHTETRLD